MKYILLDRDGVINHNAKHSRYVEAWDDFVWIDENVRAMQQLSQLGFGFIVITNQAGVGRGIIAVDELQAIHANMKAKLAEKDILIEKIYVCPHHPEDGCVCRKPRPGMIHQALKDYGLKRGQVCFVGDEPTDCLAAFNAGICSVYLGDQRKLSQLRSEEQPIMSGSSLHECINLLVSRFTNVQAIT
jgi:D-glycero-D-manno-heptose 1,7-bisphosphate phosphatase